MFNSGDYVWLTDGKFVQLKRPCVLVWDEKIRSAFDMYGWILDNEDTIANYQIMRKANVKIKLNT